MACQYLILIYMIDMRSLLFTWIVLQFYIIALNKKVPQKLDIKLLGCFSLTV